jgi:hypothetical protein
VSGYLDRTVSEVMAFARDEINHPDRDYSGLCQSFCRTAYDVDAWAASAVAAWNRIPRQHKHIGGKPGQAPRGALLYFSGGKYGHVMIAAGIKSHDKAISNDYMRQGRIDYCPRDLPRWGLTYLGWSSWTPFGELRLDSHA